jgi:hypothetical protein
MVTDRRKKQRNKQRKKVTDKIPEWILEKQGAEWRLFTTNHYYTIALHRDHTAKRFCYGSAS